jgi:hypothetical protein
MAAILSLVRLEVAVIYTENAIGSSRCGIAMRRKTQRDVVFLVGLHVLFRHRMYIEPFFAKSGA